MEPVIHHPWDLTIRQAKRIQLELAAKVSLCPLPSAIATLAAVDVSYTRWDQMGYAVLGIFQLRCDNDRSAIRVKEESVLTNCDRVHFPYVPGYLSFREIPMLLPLFKRVPEKPGLLLVDGAGIAHPRRIGLATHLGVLFDIPAIGCAKSRLVGQFEEPAPAKGAMTNLMMDAQKIGCVLRSKLNCRPLFVSPGHRCQIDEAAHFVLGLCSRYRIPDPIRLVDGATKQLRAEFQQKQKQ